MSLQMTNRALAWPHKWKRLYVGMGVAMGGLITGHDEFESVTFSRRRYGRAGQVCLLDLGGQQFIAAGVAATAFFASIGNSKPSR